MQAAGIDFHKNQFGVSQGFGNFELVSQFIPHLLTNEMNASIAVVLETEEIYQTVLSMDSDSSTGPDGFGGYKECWQIIQADFVAAVKSFFLGHSFPRSWTSTLLVSIPKIESPKSFSDLRPISLCNFSMEVISKILTTRLASILPILISEEQSGFTRVRNITENILLAQEKIQKVDAKVRGCNVVLKLDLAKAYDRLSWFFLIIMLRKFGFSEVFIDMVWRIISNCWYISLFNGEADNFFPCCREVRKGDPLSLSLFIIASEVLSRGLNHLVHTKHVLPFTMPKIVQLFHILHLLMTL